MNAISHELKYRLIGKISQTDLNIVLSELDSVLQNHRSDSVDAVKTNVSILDSFLSSKHLEGCSEKSLKYYRLTIEMLLKSINKSVLDMTTDEIRSYLSNYQNERNSSKVTVDNIRRIFSSFFSWLEDEEYIIKSPIRRIHKVKFGRTVKETFSDEEIELLRDNCKTSRNLAIIDILTSTGMRVGELVRLNRSDLDFNERECVVFGKGDSERTVYFDARAKIHIIDYLKSRKDNNPALFVSLHNPSNRLSIAGVESLLKELENSTGISNIHPHKFRRTMATRAIDKGMPIEQLQKLLGHVRIDTTLHYAMVNQENVKNAHRRYIS